MVDLILFVVDHFLLYFLHTIEYRFVGIIGLMYFQCMNCVIQCFLDLITFFMVNCLIDLSILSIIISIKSGLLFKAYLRLVQLILLYFFLFF